MTLAKLLNLSLLFYKTAGFDRDYYNELPAMNSADLENEELDDAVISDERLKYLSQFPKIGTGGDRIVYATSSKRALKVARNMNGIRQNEIEFGILSKYKSLFLPKAFYHAEDYSWIEVELVRTLNNKNEIKELIGIDGDIFLLLMEKRRYYDSFAETFNEGWFKNLSKSYLTNAIIKEIDLLINETGLDPFELSCLFNLGKSASGHLVLLDVGRVK